MRYATMIKRRRKKKEVLASLESSEGFYFSGLVRCLRRGETLDGDGVQGAGAGVRSSTPFMKEVHEE